MINSERELHKMKEGEEREFQTTIVIDTSFFAKTRLNLRYGS